jgi:hypothetical protein
MARDSEGVVALKCLTRYLQHGMQRLGVSLGRTTVIFTRWSCLLLGQGPTAGPPPGRPIAVGYQSLDLRTPRETPAREPDGTRPRGSALDGHLTSALTPP